jgi:hypothetical protein
MCTSETAAIGIVEFRSGVDLILEMIALRHQIAVLKRCGTRRPYFRRWDRLLWILLSRWCPGWWQALMIVQPDTVLWWRRNGWPGFWRYRSCGRWRGERPKISRELRELIVRMARENFLWGAPRIHGELLMLGFEVSQATVSRYMTTSDRRPGQSWRTFIRLQALSFTRRDLEAVSHSEQVGPYNQSPGRTQISLFARPSAASRFLLNSRNDHSPAQVRMPGPPHLARASPCLASRAPHFCADQLLSKHSCPALHRKRSMRVALKGWPIPAARP